MVVQLNLGEVPTPVENQITVEIVNKLTRERVTVNWMLDGPGFIHVESPTSVEPMRFRSKSGAGVGSARNWLITKGELNRLKKKVYT